MGSDNPNYITVIGETNFRNSKKKFGIKVDDRRRHMYVIGKTGMGKSAFMNNMIIQDIWAGNGVAVIDPHGDLVENVIKYVPNNRVNDVIYFNPADIEYPMAFNVLEKVDARYRHLVSSGLVGVFKKMWADSWGPRLEYLLRNAILALLEFPDSTMLGITRMMIDKEYQARVSTKITDPVVKAFWTKEFTKYTDKFAQEAVAPIQNKVGQFLSVSLIRNIVGQVKSSFNLREVMDSKKILLVNLSKGRIGEDISAMLGAMMITKLYLSAMSRVDIEEHERKDFYIYVDEFQNFATESFADILSEARKYRLCLTIAHQYIEQLDEKVKFAVLGNVGTIVLFRVGAGDAETLLPEFEPTYEVQDLINLGKFNIYLKLMIDGVSSEPFSAGTIPPFSEEYMTGNMDKIIAVSRERYARSKDVIETKIRKWAGVEDEDEEDNEDGDNENKMRQGIKLYDANCFNCGVKTQVLFEPDKKRPVYCRECLRLVRKGMIRQPEIEGGSKPDRSRENRDSKSSKAPKRLLKEKREPDPDPAQILKENWQETSQVVERAEPAKTMSLSSLMPKSEEIKPAMPEKRRRDDKSKPRLEQRREQRVESKPIESGLSLSALKPRTKSDLSPTPPRRIERTKQPERSEQPEPQERSKRSQKPAQPEKNNPQQSLKPGQVIKFNRD